MRIRRGRCIRRESSKTFLFFQSTMPPKTATAPFSSFSTSTSFTKTCCSPGFLFFFNFKKLFLSFALFLNKKTKKRIRRREPSWEMYMPLLYAPSLPMRE